MQQPLTTTRGRLASAVIFMVFAPPTLFAAGLVVLSLGDHITEEGAQFLTAVWSFAVLISMTVGVIVGLPVWVALKRLDASWPWAALAGGTAGVLTGFLFQAGANLTIVGAAIGVINGGGIWLIAYRRTRTAEFVDVF